jgi:hypothetical protein
MQKRGEASAFHRLEISENLEIKRHPNCVGIVHGKASKFLTVFFGSPESVTGAE